MCKLCDNYRLGKANSADTFKAMHKIKTPDKTQKQHLLDLTNEILDKEMPDIEPDEEVDGVWASENQS